MSIQLATKVGPQVLTPGSKDSDIRQGGSGETIVSDAHGRYQEAVVRGNVFFLAASAAAPTAYVGAGGGTPLIAVHNPANSGKYLVMMLASMSLSAAASAAGVVRFGIWVGPSVIPTGTATVPTNALTLVASGGIAKGFVNAALTGSTALSLWGAIGNYYWATAAASNITPAAVADLGGAIIIAPGNQIAIGASSALTSATWDATLQWEEVPNIG